MNHKVIVTGATGLVGSHLLIALTQNYQEVTALYRNDNARILVSKLFDYYEKKAFYNRIVWVKGDITDIEFLKGTFVNAKVIFHAAALVSFEKRDAKKLYEVNVEGTKNILQATKFNNVPSFVFISSVASIRHKNKEGFFVEQGVVNGSRKWSDYAKSKTEAEKLVLAEKKKGLKTVIVNPGVILGPGEINRSSTAIFNTVKQGLSFYTLGINGFVDVRDVVDTTLKLLALEKTQDRYICVGENSSFKNLFELIAVALNVKVPKYKANWVMLAIAWRVEFLISKIQGREPKLTKDNTSSALEIIKYDSSLIKNELDYKFRSIKNASENASNFFKYLKSK